MEGAGGVEGQFEQGVQGGDKGKSEGGWGANQEHHENG